MKSNDLTNGNLLAIIVKFSIPYLVSCALQLLYNLVDLFVVGKYCDVPSITAVSIGGQFMHFLTVIIVGLSMGTTVMLAQSIGANDAGRARKTVGNTINLFLVIGVVLAAGLYFSVDFITDLMSTPEQATRGTSNYLKISFLGLPAIVGYNIISSVFRGMGDSRTPMFVVIVACAFNIGLDFLLIGHFHLGPEGAAYGTILAQLTSVIFALIIIRTKKLLSIQRNDFRYDKTTLKNVLRVGLPIAFQDGFIQISFLVITVIANLRGLNDAAAVGVSEKIIGILFLVPSAMLSTVSAVSAQNIGAHKFGRAKLTLKYGIFIATGIGLISAFAVQLVSDGLIGLFTTDANVIVSGAQYLDAYVWDCVFAGIHFCFSGFFCACGLSMASFAHNVISIMLARIPLAYVASVTFTTTLFPMGLATVVGSLLSVVICVLIYRWMIRHPQRFALLQSDLH